MEVPLPHRIPGLLWLLAQIITHPLGWRTQGGTNKKPETSQARQLTPVIPALSLRYRTRPYPKMKIRNWISSGEAKLGGAGAQGEPEQKWGRRDEKQPGSPRLKETEIIMTRTDGYPRKDKGPPQKTPTPKLPVPGADLGWKRRATSTQASWL